MRPGSEEELAAIIAEAAANGRRLEIVGGASKAEVGAPRDAEPLHMGAFSGILDYDPAELVLTARAATPLAEIEAAVAGRGQMLPFEPFDHGPVFGRPEGAATLGGILAAGVSGSRRLSRGAARDHLLGFRAVSGRGEAFVAGGKVVKNVTGYDLSKVMAGSWGRLAALTEVTVKVVPRAPAQRSLAIRGLDPRAAVALMSRAMGAPADVAAAAHAPGFTVLRLEGFGPSVDARTALLQTLEPGLAAMDEDAATAFWAALRNPLPAAPILWRVSVPPSRAPDVIDVLGGDWTMDWAGGLDLGRLDRPRRRPHGRRSGRRPRHARPRPRSRARRRPGPSPPARRRRRPGIPRPPRLRPRRRLRDGEVLAVHGSHPNSIPSSSPGLSRGPMHACGRRRSWVAGTSPGHDGWERSSTFASTCARASSRDNRGARGEGAEFAEDRKPLLPSASSAVLLASDAGASRPATAAR